MLDIWSSFDRLFVEKMMAMIYDFQAISLKPFICGEMNFILDIDGTLWNTTEIVAEAWNDAVEDIGLGDRLGRFVTADMLKCEFGKPMDEIIDDLFPSLSQSLKENVLERIKIREKEAVSCCKTDLSYPGVTQTIAELTASGSRFFIVSNCQDGYIELVMSKLSIERYIDDYESFGRTGLSKAENIRLVMNRNRFPADSSYYIGDTLGDYRSSKEACIPFIFASYGFGSMEKDYNGLSIANFEELQNFIL